MIGEKRDGWKKRGVGCGGRGEERWVKGKGLRLQQRGKDGWTKNCLGREE